MPNHKRKTEGLLRSARERHQATYQRAKAAIISLQKQSKVINFRVVSQSADVSTAWLYAHPEIRTQIERLRSARSAQVTTKTAPASDRSKDCIIAALKLRARQLEEKNRELTRQLEIALGQLCFPPRLMPSEQSQSSKDSNK
jgi:hypothetical protein